MNPTTDVLERRIAALEGGVDALATSSGHAAQFLAFTTLAGAGNNIVSTPNLYGGSINQLRVTLQRIGTETRFTSRVESPEEFEYLTDARARAWFIESVGNPALNIPDFEPIIAAAKRPGVAVIVDNTFGLGGYLFRPFDWGAAIITHSVTKWLRGRGVAIGGWWTAVSFPGATAGIRCCPNGTPAITACDSPKLSKIWRSCSRRRSPDCGTKDSIVCANHSGSCYGSTGRCSVLPGQREPLGPRFPRLTIRDVVRAHARLMRRLGIPRATLIGGSLGGMVALEFALLPPERVQKLVVIGTRVIQGPWRRAWNRLAREAIAKDPSFRASCYGTVQPEGLALARALSMLSDRSATGFDERWLDDPALGESYVLHHGSKFIERFDANALWLARSLTDAERRFSVATLECECSVMPHTLFSQIRRRRYRSFLCAGFALLILAWLSLSFATICTRPMVKHASQPAPSCPFDMLADEVNGPAPLSSDECAVKICLDQPSDRWLWTDQGKDPMPMPVVLLFASVIIIVTFDAARRVHRLDLRPERRAVVPVIYQFCALLN